jgi:GT2 family glycosyltransferase
MVDLSVVIVSWNVRSLLQRCLRSMEVAERSHVPVSSSQTGTGPAIEVIVVDNGSEDGSITMLRSDFPSVHTVANRDNRGFAAANNQGIAVARGRYVMLLNPDTEVVGPALSLMVAFADVNPRVAVIGPQLVFPDGSIQPSRYRFPTLLTAVFESTWMQRYAPRFILNRYYVRDQPDSETHDVDWVRGAAMMVRREAIAEVGPMDEGYFMYSEELDWCRRMRDAGWRVVYLPQAQVVHHEGKSSEQDVAARHVNFQTSKIRYFRKHHGAVAADALRLVLLSNYVCQVVVEGAKWLVGHRRELRARRLAAYLLVLRSRLRPAG